MTHTAIADPAPITGPISGEDYMRVLAQRQQAWMSRNPRMTLPPLLEWFIQDGDEEHVVLPQAAPQPKRTPKPRVYATAAELVARRDKVQADMDRIADAEGPADRAVANLSPSARSKAAARAGRRRFAQLDRDLARYTELRKRRDRLDGQIANALAREARQPANGSRAAWETGNLADTEGVVHANARDGEHDSAACGPLDWSESTARPVDCPHCL